MKSALPVASELPPGRWPGSRGACATPTDPGRSELASKELAAGRRARIIDTDRNGWSEAAEWATGSGSAEIVTQEVAWQSMPLGPLGRTARLT
jgi:hypothetical protein